MPNIRIILANNIKQTQKTVLLIASSISFDPSAPTSCKSLVIATAKSKFQSKRANRVFDSAGQELRTTEQWQDAVYNDAILLVSKADEDYVGIVSDTTEPSNDQKSISKQGCPIHRLDHNAEVDVISVRQLENLARALLGVIYVVAQPDLHPGTTYPIGSVVVSTSYIHPHLIGSDIGCGMVWYRTSLSTSQVEGDKSRKIADKLRGLEGPWRTQVDREIWLRDEDSNVSAGGQWDKSLGTIGAGNHFAELQVIEECDPRTRGMETGDVVLLVHSGSRGYGGDILKRHTRDNQKGLLGNAGDAYLKEHDRACRWASRNSDLIALRFLSRLEPGDSDWSFGSNDGQPAASQEDIIKAFSDIQRRKVVDIWHNNVEQVSWPPHAPDDTQLPAPDQELAYIHRKGAAPTFNPTTKQSLNILPLPGSRATPTLILHPTFSPTNSHGKTNALSLAHGAGRARSRVDAQKYVAEKYKGRADDLVRGDFVQVDGHGNKKQESKGGRDLHGGTWVVCEDRQLVWEEAGEAYKDVWAVGDDLVRSGCAEIWGWCRPRVSYKVRRE